MDLPPPEITPSGNGEIRAWHAELLRGQFERRFTRVGGCLAQVEDVVAQQAECATAVGVRSVSPETTLLIASTETSSSSATIWR